jgi:tetratricopeptide (TPR) repeat protein
MNGFPGRVVRVLTVLLVPTPGLLSAQESPFDRAATLIEAGQLVRALAVYDSLLAIDGEDLPARLGRAHVLSWTGRDAAAEGEFGRVLAADPSNLSARLGQGYNHAWRGRYEEAERAFLEARALNPESVEVAKARAYLALWRSDSTEAMERFQALAQSDADDAGVWESLGNAQLSAGRPGAALQSFQRVLTLAPEREAARRGLEAAHYTPAKVELSVWGGYTAFSRPQDVQGDSENRVGIRSGRLALRINPNLTVWGMVDDGLSLDNRGLATAGDHIPSYLAGGLLGWGGRFITKVEAGWRELGTAGQRMVSAEQVVGLPNSLSLKAGAWVGPRDDHQTEWVAHGGLGFPLSSRFSVELLGFLSDNGLPGGDGKRVLLSGDYRFPSGWQVMGGGAFGETGIGLSETTKIGEGFFSVSMPIRGGHRAQLSLRHQSLADADGITVASLGITLGLMGG